MCDEETLVVGRVQRDPLPHAITITIVDSSGLDDTGTSLVASVEPQEMAEAGQEVLEVGDGTGRHLEGKCDTHKINSKKFDMSDEEVEDEEAEEEEEEEEEGEEEGLHCLVCNLALSMDQADQHVAFFKSVTTATNRKMPVLLGTLAGCTITSRKAHSDFVCRRCFNLLDRIDALEVEMKETKEEIVSKYQETVAVYGGRARRRKPTTVRKKDYVFPKIEPEDEAEQLVEADIDENFEPKVEDLMEEEQDRQEEDSQDDEWEPEFKRPRVKREQTEFGPPKRKRGRPRKDSYSRQKSAREQMMGCVAQAEVASADQQSKQDQGDSCPWLTTEEKQSSSLSYSNKALLSQGNSLQLRLTAGLVCVCGTASSTTQEHISHVLSHVSGPFKCPTCSCSFCTSASLALHQRLIHGAHPATVETSDGWSTYSSPAGGCVQCGESVEEAHLYQHTTAHIEGTEQCPVCALRFLTSSAVEVHIRCKHFHFLPNIEKYRSSEQESSGVLECDVCGQKFSLLSRLIKHRYQHHPEHFPWSCGKCSLTFSSQDSLEFHNCLVGTQSSSGLQFQQAKLNQGKRPQSCPVCLKPQKSHKALTDHLRHQCSQGFTCGFCNTRLKSAYSLKIHINSQHTQMKQFQCKYCMKVFFASSNLSSHVKFWHTDRNNYSNLCHLCGEAYLSPYHMKHHLRSHSKEKRYMEERLHRCPHCDAGFNRPYTLKQHIQKLHNNSSTKHSSTSTARSTSTPSNNTTTRVSAGASVAAPITCAPLTSVVDSWPLPSAAVRVGAGTAGQQAVDEPCLVQYVQMDVAHTVTVPSVDSLHDNSAPVVGQDIHQHLESGYEVALPYSAQ